MNDKNRGFPSMTALLGLIAIAGYQNRDKIAELLRGRSTDKSRVTEQSPRQAQQQGGLDGLLDNLGNAGGIAGILGGGLRELVDRFRQSGQGEAAGSWVGTGPNREIAPQQLEQAIGSDVLATLSQQTGLSREELLARLSRELPDAVDKYTPEGRLPTTDELSRS